MNSFFLIFVLFFLRYFINCDECQTKCLKSGNNCVDIDSYNSCPSYCKPNFLSLDNKGCFKCNIGNLLDNQCYYFSNDGCHSTSIENASVLGYNKVINSSPLQCSSSCGQNLYQMGDFCYENCIGGNRVPKGTSSKQCECRYLYEIEDVHGREQHNCLNEGESCKSYDFFDFDTNKCVSSCSGKLKKTITMNGNKQITRCSNNCLEGEYENSGTCSDDCPKYYKIENGKKVCVNNCEVIDKTDTKKCLSLSECKYISEDKKCLDECKPPLFIYKNKYCNSACSLKYYLDTNGNKICIENCPSKYVKSSGNECQLNTDKCFYTTTSGENRICYESCPSNKFCYDGDFYIRNACGGNFLYRTENGNICYKSCNLIPSIGGKYYPDGYICRCYFYDNVHNNCYNSEYECAKKGYIYIEGNICKTSSCSASKPYKVKFTKDSISFYRCYNLTECKQNNYYYYYKDSSNNGECWVKCLNNKYPNENDANYKPKPNNSGNTCVPSCASPFPKLSNGICKSQCPQNEYFNDDSENFCKDDCNKPYIYIYENNKCSKTCRTNYYKIKISDEKYRCVSNCATYKKYSLVNSDMCYDDCYINNNQYKYNGFQCVIKCPSYTYNNICLTSMIQGKFYYSDLTIVDSCNPYYISKTTSNLCVTTCGSDMIYENRCRVGCPLEAPYIDKDVNNNKICVPKCIKKTIAFENECVNSCTNPYYPKGSKCYKDCGSQYLNPKTGGCTSTCPNEFKYHEKIKLDNNHEIYICKSSCDGDKKFIYNNECVEHCIYNNHYYIDLDNNCKQNCGNYKFYYNGTFNSIDIYRCTKTCPNEKYIYEVGGTDKKCYEKCPNGKRRIVQLSENNYKCVNECPEEYPFYYNNNVDAYIPCTNYYKCPNGQYFKDGNCVSSCGGGLIYIKRKKCSSDCNGYGYIKSLGDGHYECKESCENNEFNERISSLAYPECVSICKTYKKIGNDKVCKSGCNEALDGKYFYPFSGTGTNTIYKCTKTCSNTSYPLTTESSNECLNSCKDPDKYLSKSENKCYKDCGHSPRNKYTQEGTKECLFECNNPNYPYYYSSSKKCVNKCLSTEYAIIGTNECVSNCKPSGHYEYDTSGTSDSYYKVNTCVVQCPPNKPYAEESGGHIKCKDQCSSTNKFFIREFKHYETNLQKICQSKCPTDYPYYTIYKDNNNKYVYGCQNTCDEGYLIIRGTDDILCIPECPYVIAGYPIDISAYKYKYIDDNNKKRCTDSCPSPNKKFHKIDDGSDCLKKCPDDTPFYEFKNVICKNENDISCKYINYETGECLESNKNCKDNSQHESKIKGLDKYICSNQCNTKYGIYETPYNSCVNDCLNDELVSGKNLIYDNQNKKCVCKNLFYKDKKNKNEIVCFKNSLNNTKCKYLHGTYNVNMYGTNECIEKNDCKNKNGILSPSNDICYDKSEYKCEVIDKNSIVKNTYYCMCKYKHYKRKDIGQCNFSGCNIDLLDMTICLDENGVCPLGYGKLINENNQCVNECPSGYNSFRNICLTAKECNDGKFDKNCQCYKKNKKFWYKVKSEDKYIYHCLDTSCPKGYPVYAPDVSENECLQSCIETYYPYFYDNKCYTSCANSDLLNIINGFEIFEPPKGTEVSKLSKFHCDCLNPWYYYDGNARKSKKCSESVYPDSIADCNNFTNPEQKFKYLVKHTLECRKEDCPSEYPFHFNNECFKNCETDAESYYHYLKKKNDKECECINLWFINSINKSECIEIDVDECIKFNFSLKYKINETRQCVSECPPGYVSFNYICYNKCPENTTLNETDPTSCKCNTNITNGYWYRYEKYNGTNYLKCALEECPKENDGNNITHARKNLVEEKSECLLSCSKDDKFKYALRYICREECPYFTDKNAENDECVFFDLNNDVNITNITLFKDAANVQAKELYEGSEHLGGYLYNRFNASLHIYPIDINNSLANISFKSNLTYVDFSTCVQKIFANNKKYLNKSHTILVAKYDILTDTINEYSNSKTSEKDKYLINKVEYELFSSNMSEKLEMNWTTCDPYELIVSYPLTLNRFNRYEGAQNLNEYRKKFEMGKKLHLRDNNIDTFNINNTVYKSFCRSVEIDGKDLVYEDRYKYLYPNNKVLCESNCIMNNTNFDLERIICLCSYKEEIVFNREDEAVDIFNDPNFTIPTQSRFNAEAVKCLFNFTLNETIFYNDAFYYSSVILVMKFSMIFVTSFSGVKNLAANIKHLLSKLNKNKNFGKKSNKSTKRIQFNNDNAISTTGRALNNPPKKNKYNEKYNEDIDLDSDDGENNINNTILENIEEEKGDEVANYEINIKKGVNPNNRDNIYDNKNNKKKDSSDNNNNIKAEYIPPDYNFKFFRPKDKSVMKKIDRSEIPFDINPETNYLIERRKGIDYPEDYLNGPYYPEQNIIIIIDSKNKDPTKLAKFLKNEKMMKKKPNATDRKNLDESKNNNNINNNNTVNDKKSNKFTINEKTKNSFYKPQNIGEKSFVSIKKVNPNDNSYEGKAILDELDGDHETKTIDDDTSIFSLIKREHLFLRVNYKTYIRKAHPHYLHIFFAEIFDKIYIFKILFFLRQTDIFSLYFSLYLFCHILLLTLLCNLFTIDLIRKIWETTDFPDLNFYLLYGLISNLIIWVIYQIFSCLIDFDGSIRDLVVTKNNMQKNANSDDDSVNESIENKFYSNYNCLMCLIRFRISIFHILTFAIAVCCGIYLIAFFALYTGTKSLVLKIYYISIVEILLIKITYGMILSGIRIVSIEAKLKFLYIFVYILDKYLS